MLIPHVVQTEADKVFVNILNLQAAALDNGDAVVWSGSSPDGVRTTQPATATLSLLVGIADGTIAASGYGLAQAYGYKAAINVTGDSTHAIVVGDVLIPVDGVDYFTWSIASDGLTGFVYAGEAVASSAAAATYKGFIRCL